MPKAKRKGQNKSEAKVKFFGHEIVLTFMGSLIMALGVFLATIDLQPTLLTWVFSAVVIWLGLLIFLFPIVRKIESLM